MSFGRKKNSAATQPTTTVLPNGDKVLQKYTKGGWVVSTQMTPQSQAQYNAQQFAIQQLTNDLNTPPEADALKAENFKNTILQSLRSAITRDSNERQGLVQSDLSKRFGGSTQSTFATDLLGQLEKDRLSQLSQAEGDATLLGEQLKQETDNARLRKLQILQGQVGASLAPTYGAVDSAMRQVDVARQMMMREAESRSNRLSNLTGWLTRSIF